MTTLVTLRPGVTFEAMAAASFARMERDRGKPLDVNFSTRAWDLQMSMYLAWEAYVNGKGPKPNHGRAIHPKYSWHVPPIARALDTDDDVWIRQHPEYGWLFVVADEKWHAQYYPNLDKFLGQPTGNEQKEEEEMSITILERKGNPQATKSLYDVKTGRAVRAISQDENTAFRAAQENGGAIYISVLDAEYKNRGGF